MGTLNTLAWYINEVVRTCMVCKIKLSLGLYFVITKNCTSSHLGINNFMIKYLKLKCIPYTEILGQNCTNSTASKC